MILKVINSNSQGNCYILETENSALLIECGVAFSEIKEAINFNISKIDACLITHEHGDHAKSIKEVQSSGIPIVASTGTFDACGTSDLVNLLDFRASHGCMFLTPIKRSQEHGWQVNAFNVDHDASEPLGFIIEHPDCGKVLFVTDTYVLRYKFPFEFDHVIIEANYCENLAEDWRQSKGNNFVEGRRLKNHMSFQTALLTLSKMNLSRCKNIVLIHLSDGLTDAKRFKEEMEGAFGIPTTVAAPKVEVNFSLNPY
jgi:phosphoribosyl 1,2-cyclic phosphodiesterase